jgi:hypothetical protein
MKSLATRVALAAALALVSWLALAGATAPRSATLAPDKLIILSTTDDKGKTSPCG